MLEEMKSFQCLRYSKQVTDDCDFLLWSPYNKLHEPFFIFFPQLLSSAKWPSFKIIFVIWRVLERDRNAVLCFSFSSIIHLMFFFLVCILLNLTSWHASPLLVFCVCFYACVRHQWAFNICLGGPCSKIPWTLRGWCGYLKWCTTSACSHLSAGF